MTIKNKGTPADIGIGTLMKGGRWIAFAGFAYVVAWIVGLAIGLTTSSPGPTDSISTIGGYFSAHREAAMIQAYFLDGLAGVSLLVFRTHALPRWLGWVAAVLAPLLVIAGWNFALSPSVQYAAYTVLLIVLLLWVATVGVISLGRAA